MTIPFFCSANVLYEQDIFSQISNWGDGWIAQNLTDRCGDLIGEVNEVKAGFWSNGTTEISAWIDFVGDTTISFGSTNIITATTTPSLMSFYFEDIDLFFCSAGLYSIRFRLQRESGDWYSSGGTLGDVYRYGENLNCIAGGGSSCGNTTDLYFIIYGAGIPQSFINLNYPVNEEIVATTSVDFSANYWNIDNFEKAGFKITQQDNYFGTTYLEGNAIDGQSAYSTTTELQKGAYSYQAYLSNATTTIHSTDIFTFYVLENPYTYATTTIINTDFNCDDLGTIAGAFCSVLVKLFKPSPESLSRFASLKTIIEKKPPFGYFTTIKSQYSQLGATTTPAFVLQQITPITNNVFSPLKTGLAWILWLFFGFYAIKRISGYNL